MVSRKCSNGILSRKKKGLVGGHRLDHLDTERRGGGGFQFADQFGEVAQTMLAHDRQQAAFGEVLLSLRAPGRNADAKKLGADSRNPAGSCALSREQAHEPGGNFVKRQHSRTDTGMRHLPGHAPHHARRFVLRQDASACGDDRLRAAQAVRAHAGEHQGEHLRAPDLGGRRKQRIDGGLAEIHQRAVVDRNDGHAVAALDRHVPAAGGKVDGADIDLLAIPRLAHRTVGGAGEMLGHDCGEGRRHMLGDEHRGTVKHAANLGDDGVERLRAASRGTDHQHARRRRRHRAQRDRSLGARTRLKPRRDGRFDAM